MRHLYKDKFLFIAVVCVSLPSLDQKGAPITHFYGDTGNGKSDEEIKTGVYKSEVGLFPPFSLNVQLRYKIDMFQASRSLEKTIKLNCIKLNSHFHTTKLL